MGLFAMILAYQFLPRTWRKKKQPSRLQALAPPKPTPSRTRSRFHTLVTIFKPKGQTTTNGQEDTSRGHRVLHSFHLTPERRKQRDRLREKFATSHRLNLDFQNLFPHPRSQSSPRTPRKMYSKIDDTDDSSQGLLKPDPAVISPWSPSEEVYLRTPPPLFKPFRSPISEPGTPPPLYPPPPAYVPGTPLRNNFTSQSDADEKKKRRDGIVDPFNNAVVQDSRNEDQRLMDEIQAVLEFTRSEEAVNESSFVIAEDNDADSDTWSNCSLSVV